MFKNVNFTGANTCVMGAKGGDINGIPLAAVGTDILENPRNPNYPYKRAYAEAALKVLNLGGGLQGVGSDAQITVTLPDAD